MQIRRKFNVPIYLAILITLVSVFIIYGALPARGATIIIDGVKEADWGEALAIDPTGDMSETNLDLQGLYVVQDADNFYIGFDATASSWGMAYGIYLDTDQVPGSGSTSDPWGRSINAVNEHLPEHTLYVWHDGGDFLQDVQLNHWNGSGWLRQPGLMGVSRAMGRQTIESVQSA
jgi:hypothetical protein